MEITNSVNGVPIRLTNERWQHIVGNKPYMQSYYDKILDTVENPTWILRGHGNTLIAVQSIRRLNHLHVVYREINRNDGFVITAFLARKVNRGTIIWRASN